MVHEREPPRISTAQNSPEFASLAADLETRPAQPLQPTTSNRMNQLPPNSNKPHFGAPTELRNPLLRKSNTGPFIPTKPGDRRVEHHASALDKTYGQKNPVVPDWNAPGKIQDVDAGPRPISESSVPKPPPGASHLSSTETTQYRISSAYPGNLDTVNPIPLPTSGAQRFQGAAFAPPLPDVFEIPKPANFVHRTIPPAPRPQFSSATGFDPNAFKVNKQFVDLTLQKDEEGFDASRAPGGDDRYGAWDPSNFMDSAQASENIKALLEGAFEDEEDKPKTRLRKKKAQEQTLATATQKLQALDVSAKPRTEERPEEEEDDGSVEGLKVKLLPHQIDGVAWMMDKEAGERKKNGVLPHGGILADDMGLGKTIQALSLILSNPRPAKDAVPTNPKRKIPEAVGKGTLVVAPLALIKQWEAEIRDKVDTLQNFKVLVHHGASRTKRFEDLKKYDVVITTYHTLTSEHEGSSPKDDGIKVGCFGIHWYRVILDEAHSIKNRNAKMTKAACELKAVYRWCMTGTPMQNNLDELQSLIHFLRIKPYNQLASWKEQIITPMKNGKGGLAMKRLQYFLKAFMKRRTKDILQKEGALTFGRQTTTDAHKEGFKIVGRTIKSVVAEFDDAEREFYDNLAARTAKSLDVLMSGGGNDYIAALVLLLRLRQICNHPELIRASLRKEKDSLTTAQQTSISSQSNVSDDMDQVADMFGSLTVKNQKCDVCQTKLGAGEVSSGALRCFDCETDLSKQLKSARRGKHQSHIKAKKVPRGRRIIPDDSDDDEGEWIVPNKDQTPMNLGKAGGSDDEDAEGGGEWLGADNSDTDDETSPRLGKFAQKSKRDDSISNEEDESDSDSSISDGGLVPSTKIRHLIKILKKESGEHKFIVFSEFTSMLDIVEPFLTQEGLRYTRYDGKMKNDDREASLKRLREDRRTRILLCSLRCGSLGLNLTAASRVVILEPFWNPFVEEQAIDRVHRLNQTQDVVVYKLTVADSVEERILDLQEKKRELARVAIEGGKGAGKLSMKDILHLFKRDAEYGSKHEDAMSLAVGLGRPAGLLESSPARTKPTLLASTTLPQNKKETPQGQNSRYPGYGNESVYGRRW